MRCVFSFQIESFTLRYRLLLLSYLKEIVRSQSEDFYQSFFVDREKETKEFCFAPYFPNIQIEGDEIVSNTLNLTVSSSNYEMIIHLINGAQQKKEYYYKGSTMKFIGVKMMKEKPIIQSPIWFKTLSPMLIESKDKKPLLAGDENFEKELNIICSKMIESKYGRSLYQPIKILKHHLKKTVIKENLHQKSGDLFFTGNIGQVLLDGDPRDLNVFYMEGISLRSNQGFGCLDVV
ncbi:CRISPR-associated endoribonuclease Cas6 [Niallia sp. 03133]|uniref:CRISPR-associated endoribonuclease Cas6 n=1 Tax=Niallia sp. 03133 TaxID=3458060 RepID=UPI00404445F4